MLELEARLPIILTMGAAVLLAVCYYSVTAGHAKPEYQAESVSFKIEQALGELVAVDAAMQLRADFCKVYRRQSTRKPEMDGYCK